MIPVTKPMLARMLLEDLIEQSNEDMETAVRRFHAAGITPELIDNLRRRPVQDIVEITTHPESLGITYSIDAKRINGYFALIDMRKRDGELGDFEYFVKNGAEQNFICRLFGKSIEEVRELASLFPKASSKMPPDESLRDEIHEVWAHLCSNANMDIRQRIRELHQVFPDWSIASLLKTINEFTEFKSSALWLDSEIAAEIPSAGN